MLLVISSVVATRSFSENPFQKETFRLERLDITCDEIEFGIMHHDPFVRYSIPVKIALSASEADSAKMRIRGESSRAYPVKSYTLRFGEETQLKKNLRRLNLAYGNFDPSHIRVSLASYVFNKSGYPCFKSTPVALMVNNSFKGFYNKVESVDRYFLKSRGFSELGNLYKADRDSSSLSKHEIVEAVWTKETNKETNSFTDLVQLINMIDTTPEAQYQKLMYELFDYEKLIHIIAVNLLISNSSTYYHNYYMYNDPNAKKWIMLPWDLDITFSVEAADDLYSSLNTSDMFDCLLPSNPLIERAFSNPAMLNDIRNKVTQLSKTVFTNESLDSFLDSYERLMIQYADSGL